MPETHAHSRDRIAADLYREALEKVRDCCGCGEGSAEEAAADLLTSGPGVSDWPRWVGDVYDEARELLRERYGIEA
jgi:hypothetical protein